MLDRLPLNRKSGHQGAIINTLQDSDVRRTIADLCAQLPPHHAVKPSDLRKRVRYSDFRHPPSAVPIHIRGVNMMCAFGVPANMIHGAPSCCFSLKPVVAAVA